MSKINFTPDISSVRDTLSWPCWLISSDTHAHTLQRSVRLQRLCLFLLLFSQGCTSPASSNNLILEAGHRIKRFCRMTYEHLNAASKTGTRGSTWTVATPYRSTEKEPNRLWLSALPPSPHDHILHETTHPCWRYKVTAHEIPTSTASVCSKLGPKQCHLSLLHSKLSVSTLSKTMH